MPVQAFVPQTAAERLDIGVLIGLARLDQEQPDAAGMRPGQHRPAAELLAVAGADRLRQATLHRQPVQNARQRMATDGPFWHHGYRLVRRVVHDGQALDDAPFSRPAEHEVHRPDLVRRIDEAAKTRGASRSGGDGWQSMRRGPPRGNGPIGPT